MSPNAGSCGCRNDRHKLKTSTAEIHFGKQRACRKCLRDTMLKLAGVSYPFWSLPKGQVITIIIGLLLCLLWTQLPKCVASNREHDHTNTVSQMTTACGKTIPYLGSQCPPVGWQNSVSRDCWHVGLPEERPSGASTANWTVGSCRIITGNGATATTSKANGGTFCFAPKFWWGRAWAKKFGTRFRSDSDSCWITTNHLYLILINSILHFVYVLFVNSLKFKTQWDHRCVRWFRALWSQPSYLDLFSTF